MPGNVLAPVAVGVFPKVRLSGPPFAESRIFPVLFTPYYHDGSCDRSITTDGVNTPESLRTYVLSIRDTPSVLAILRTFIDSHSLNLVAFYWYHPYEQTPGQAIGSNYDETGVSIVGRHTCVVRGDTYNEMMTGNSRGDAMVVLAEVG